MTRSLYTILFLFLFLSLLHLATGPLYAQEKLDVEAERAAVAKLLEEHSGGETAEDRGWADAAKKRLALLDELVRTRQQAAELDDIPMIAERKAKVEKDAAGLKALREPEPFPIKDLAEQTKYKKRHTAAGNARKLAEDALNRLRETRESESNEQKELPAREANAQRDLAGLTGDDPRTKYRIETASLEVKVIEARRLYLNRASPTQSALLELRQLELDLARNRLARETKVLEFANAAAADLREKLAEDERTGKESREEKDGPLEEYERLLASQASDARVQTLDAGTRVDTLHAEIAKRKEVIGQIRSVKTHLETRIGFGDAEVGNLLRHSQKRAEVAILDLDENVRPTLDAENRATQQELISVLDRIYELQLPSYDSQEVGKILESVAEEERKAAAASIRETIHGEDGLLTALRTRQAKLEELQTLEGELVATVAETIHELRLFLEFVRSNLLFSQSDDPLSLETIRGAVEEIPKLAAIYSSRSLRDRTSSYVRSVTRGAILLLFLLMIISVAIYVPRQLRKRTDLATETVDEKAGTAFMGRGAATVRFLLAALPPAALFLAYRMLSGLEEMPRPLDDVLLKGFWLAAVLLGISRLTRWLLHPAGVGIHVMGIRPENARSIQRTIILGAVSALFLLIPAKLILATDAKLIHLPRLLHLTWLVILAGCLFVLTRRRGPILRQIAKPGQMLDRLWIVVGPVLVFVLVAMVVLEIAGYRVASETIARAVMRSIVVLIVVAMLHSFLVKLIGRLAKHVRNRLVTDLGYAAARESSEEVSDQLTRLSASLIVGATILLMLGSWDEVLVLFELLDDVRLAELGPDRYLTLLSVLWALLSVVAGHFIVANLSAVYEFIVFPLIGTTKRGGQFVLLALSRYAILLVAYGLALMFLGLRLSSIGWLLTAASVGIGFGLQEIIANFVAGLILLLERPFQVGDIIEVEDTSGTVDSISIRSTIVTNWDRQSVIIPNKDFITKKMTNWTRNDDVTRRKLEIRVAFGSDLKKVNRVLEETVRAHPNVLADPAPRIWMSSYESSGFGILVYFFTHVDNGLTTRAELYERVYEALAGEGVEVPLTKHEISVIHEPPAADGTGKEE